MNKLSSRWTFFYKRVFPVIWYGFLVPFLFLPLLPSHKGSPPTVGILIVPLLMGVLGYHFMRNTVFDLVDEAFDEGTTLLFRNHKKEVRINLADIKNVSYTTVMNPQRVTVTVRHETQFGRDLTFAAPAGLIPFKKNEYIVKLIDRIDKARG